MIATTTGKLIGGSLYIRVPPEFRRFLNIEKVDALNAKIEDSGKDVIIRLKNESSNRRRI